MDTDEQQRAILLRFSRIEAIDIPANGEWSRAAQPVHTVVICQSGAGSLQIKESVSSLCAQEGYFLSAGQAFHITADEEPIKGWCISYDVFEEAAEQQFSRNHRYMDGWSKSLDANLVEKYCVGLMRSQSSTQREAFREQAMLYSLISFLIQGSEQKSEQQTKSAIEATAQYMEQHLDRDLTRNELAMIAGLSPTYFSHVFQRQMGKPPSAYLMDIRMLRAEEMLLAGSGVKETAARVGFEDEFYFSRRFKQRLGLSPAAFVKSRRRNIASVSDPLSGSLLALRLLPKAAALYSHHELYHRMIRLHSCEEGTGEIWERNLSMLKKTEPELIFCTDLLNEQAKRELAEIAPIISIPWLDADWRQQLVQMAEAAGEPDDAVVWLSQYSKKAEDIRRKVKYRIGGATVNIWRVMDDEYRIYGARNAGAVLYRDFHFAPTHQLDEQMVFETVTREELPQFDADVLIVMVDASFQAEHRWRALQATREWRELKAVKAGRSYEIGTDKLFEYSAWSHDRALSYLGQLLI